VNLGIDFGTTNSSIAFQRTLRHAPECSPVDDHSNTPFDVVLRSAVLLDEHGRVVPEAVGSAATDPLQWKDSRTKRARRLIRDFKPLLGTFRLREQRSVEYTRIDRDHYDHLRQEPMVISIRDIIETGDVPYTRAELVSSAAAIFRRLFEKTPRSVIEAIPQIVVGIPLTFPDYAKKRLLEILVKAGVCTSRSEYKEILKRVRFLPEPVAASLLYAAECEPPRGRGSGRVLVFDSGGGTLDLALLEFEVINGHYRPIRQLALASKILAGRRFDQAIESAVLARFRNRVLEWNRGAADPIAVTDWQVAQAAESIKVALSTREEHRELSLIGAGVQPVVTRREFEEACQPLIIETREFIETTVDDVDSVDTVVMVGGSSLIPCVQRLLRSMFPTAEVIHENPAQTARGEGVERALTAVSRGLALYDDLIASEGITPFSYGFWDTLNCETITAVPKWSPHSAKRETVKIPAARGSDAMTLTLVQELVDPERVLNVLNVPVSTSQLESAVHVQVSTTDGSLYPGIELIDAKSGKSAGRFSVDVLSERELKALVTDDDHVVRWPDSRREGDTPYPEIVTLKVGDEVVCVQRGYGRAVPCRGLIERIDRISNGLRFTQVGHWDLRRWRFYIRRDRYSLMPFNPTELSDIRLARKRDKTAKVFSVTS
jgi:hypothetical protein